MHICITNRLQGGIVMLGIDVGYGYTKAYPGEISFPTVYSTWRERRLENKGELIDNMEIQINNNRYFIGNLALNEGGIATHDKYNYDRHKVCLLTAIALSKGNYSGAIVTGLPISDLHLKTEISKLKGLYQIELGPKYEIEISEVLVFPQAGASFFDLLLNEEGKAYNDLGNQRVGIIDIGEKTVDFCYLNHICYVNEKSGSLPIGMSRAHKRLLDKLYHLDINVLLHQVPEYFNKIPEDTETEYKILANEILDNISARWNYKELDKIYISGGGGNKLYSYLQERIKCELTPDAQMSNARGFYKCGIARGY